jgi:hypothetical protein
MNINAKARRRNWTVEEWANFSKQCRTVRDHVDELIRNFPETARLKSRHLQAWIRVHTAIVFAMIRLENVLADQHGETVAGIGVISFIHGSRGTVLWARCHGRVGNDVPILSRLLWIEQGRCVKEIWNEIHQLVQKLLEIVPQSSVVAKKFRSAERSIDRARSLMDSLVVLQHPDWPEFSKVFYGPIQPGEVIGTEQVP